MNIFKQGCKDALPIGLGYFAVSFALGIAMKNAGMNWIEGFFMSLCNLASAGEYAGIQVIVSNGTYFEMFLMTLIANARYMLMSFSLSQKIDSNTKMKDRLCMSYAITDELYALAISQDNNVNPMYFYGAMSVSVLPWAIGTSFGIVLGNILPNAIVSALSVALYGMFLAIIIPPCKKDQTIAFLVILCFICSYFAELLPYISTLASGTRLIILTITISVIASIIKPIRRKP